MIYRLSGTPSSETYSRSRATSAASTARFQAVDLRWGVSEEASLDQQAAAICLQELERRQRVSPRPNFLVLLGDRYESWLPPTRIPGAEFEALYQQVLPDAQQILDAWYQQNMHAVPPE